MFLQIPSAWYWTGVNAVNDVKSCEVGGAAEHVLSDVGPGLLHP